MTNLYKVEQDVAALAADTAGSVAQAQAAAALAVAAAGTGVPIYNLLSQLPAGAAVGSRADVVADGANNGGYHVPTTPGTWVRWTTVTLAGLNSAKANLAGATFTGPLVMAANVEPDVANTRTVGTSAKPFQMGYFADLTITGTSPELVITGASGSLRAITAQTGGVARWRITLGSTTAETGSDSGSEFSINRYSDAGALLGTAVTISRATGQVTLPGMAFIPSTSTVVPSYTIRPGTDNTQALGTSSFRFATAQIVKVDAADLNVLRPSDFWATGYYYGVGGYGNLASQGGYNVALTWNGYRDTGGVWKSLAANGYTAAAVVALGNGGITFGYEAVKADGSSQSVASRMTLNETALTMGANVSIRTAGTGDISPTTTNTGTLGTSSNIWGAVFTGAVRLRQFTVATLPAASTWAGSVAYATDLRVFNGAGTLEGAAAGTGGLVTSNGTVWRIAGTNITASA